jgi:putative ATP-dependent endonuclease of OLD family
LIVNWTALVSAEIGSKRYGVRPEIRSGKEAKGPIIAPEVRDLLRATYLRPLRDVEHALSAGRGSRLSQILLSTPSIKTEGGNYDPTADPKTLDLNALSVLGIGDLANLLLTKQKASVDAKTTIDDQLASFAITLDPAVATHLPTWN